MMAGARSNSRGPVRALAAALLAMSMAGGALGQDAPTPAPAPGTAPGTAPGSPSLDEAPVMHPTSSWSGEIELPGDPLAITVHFDVPIPGAATMDIPGQGMSGEPLSLVQRGEGFIRFQLRTMGRAEGSAEFDLVVGEGGATAEGTMKQHGQTFKVTLSRVFEAPPADPDARPARPQTPQEPFLYTIRPVSFSSAADAVRISGTLTIPGQPPAGRVYDKQRHPAVIIVGGFPARDRDGTVEWHKPFWVLADHLAMKGIATLRIDDRGVGRSEGDKAGATLADLVADVRAAVGILRVQPDIDADRIVLIGFDEGATVAARAGAEIREVQATILIATRITPADALPNAPAEGIEPEAKTKPALNVRGGGEHRAAYWDQHDHDTDHALMKQEGAGPVEVMVIENLNASLQTLEKGGDPSRVGAIEETMSPVALRAITAWLGDRFKQ